MVPTWLWLGPVSIQFFTDTLLLRNGWAAICPERSVPFVVTSVCQDGSLPTILDGCTTGLDDGLFTCEGNKLRPDGKPFRWNVSNPSLIHRLKSGDTQVLPDYQLDRLLRCGASTLRAGDFDFVFVGRSLESVHDVLSGALAKSTWYDRLQLLQASFSKIDSLEEIRDRQFSSFANYLEVSQLTPKAILNRPRPVAFVDIVAKGNTFGTLLEILKRCSSNESHWESALEKLHWVAVLADDPTRLHDPIWKPTHSAWTEEFQPSQFTQIIINADLWLYLADEQDKTTYAYAPWSWGSNKEPAAEQWHGSAARGARELYRFGEKSKRRLAALLDEPPEPGDDSKHLARALRSKHA